MNHQSSEWMKLDNAALIYPAVKRRDWTALFRLSATLTEPVDADILDAALQVTLRRFPAFGKRLRHGLFWCYLEEIKTSIRPEEDVANPCVRMDLRKRGGYMFRVRYYLNRIAVEIFHVLTDGTGGLCFLQTLTAEYLKLKYGARIPRGGMILDCDEMPTEQELEDSFMRYARSESMDRREAPAYRIRGTGTKHHMRITTGMIPIEPIKKAARDNGVSIGEFITAVLIQAVYDLQKKERRSRIRRLPVKINVPVNLRQFYPSSTLRNFASYINTGIDPRYGEYSFQEILNVVRHQMGLELTEKQMNAKFSKNVASEKNVVLRMAPLPLKHGVLRVVYMFVGDRYYSSCVSNLGKVELPKEMQQYVTRLDFMLGPLARNPVTCACLSYNGEMIINFTRTIVESEVERGFFTKLVRMGIPVKIESNSLN